jgi:beta-glucanase (GH16 family)
MRNFHIYFYSLFCFFSMGSCISGEEGNPSDGTSGSITIPTEGFISPTSYPGMTLTWSDEFDGSSLNTTNWTQETGTGQNGWGNNELQFYRPQNTSFQDGHLIITAKKESFGGREYTSSRIITKDKKQFRYGRVDIRAAMPRGQGLWPALWMLGSNFDTVGWPACGEIDIMEMVGGNGRENTVHGTVHWQNNGKHAEFGGQYKLSSGTLADKFHVFSIIWDAKSIRWLIDNKEFHVIDTTPAELDEFRRSFFFIFNVAVGGNWPGSPNESTVFPQHMIVDYIRVFQAN